MYARLPNKFHKTHDLTIAFIVKLFPSSGIAQKLSNFWLAIIFYVIISVFLYFKTHKTLPVVIAVDSVFLRLVCRWPRLLAWP